MTSDEQYMNFAISESRRAFDNDEVPVGAVIVHNGEIIARAHNQIKMLKDPTAHAEMIAITQAAAHLENERLIGCDLYVTVEPCAMCIGASILARFRRIVFGAVDTKTGACGSAVNLTKEGLFNHTLEIVGGVLEPECRTIMQEFFLAKR